MKKSFLEFAKSGFVLLDGGFGTELQKAGLPGGVAPETLNTTAPEKVLAVHRAYAAAGANVISSNTFGANRRKHPAPEKPRRSPPQACALRAKRQGSRAMSRWI